MGCIHKNSLFHAVFFAGVLFSVKIMGQSLSDSSSVERADNTVKYIVTTTQEQTFIGQIADPAADPVVIVTTYGMMNIPRDQIKTMKKIKSESIRQGKYWFPNPNQSRLFFAPTARMLEKGEGYFADYYLFFPGLAIGVSDHFTLSGGCSLFPGAGFDDQIFYLAPKVGLVAKEKFQIALGGLFLRMPNWDDEDALPTVGVLYGVSTFGKENANFTLGLGYGFTGDQMADKPVVVLGGESRISRRMSFVTENWIIPGLDPMLLSYGLRFMGEKMAVDFAFITPTGSEAFFPGIPFVDFVFNF
jgi:hypothetical protein